METGHTKTPWRWGDGYKQIGHSSFGEEHFIDDKDVNCRLMGPNDEEIIPIRIDHYGPLWDIDPKRNEFVLPKKGDRDFILRAVNSHDELLEAVKYGYTELRNSFEWALTHNQMSECVKEGRIATLEKMRSVISRVEGKP